jgi:PadR family transcriptional regulator PadR
MSKEECARSQIPQGTLDLIVMRTLATLGPQHAYGLALRLQQISDALLNLNQGTLYPALLRLEQQGLIKGAWRTTEHNREAKYYSLTRIGEKVLAAETKRWNRLAWLMEKLLRDPA